MRIYDTILFDLDGTIIDSAEGIFNCLDYSLQCFGIKQPREAFYKCLGPALRTSLLSFLPAEYVEKALGIYRNMYSSKGLFECTIYNGVPQMLHELKKNGFCIGLATSKPEVYAKTILKHLNLDTYFDFIGGAVLDSSRDSKAQVIEHVIASIGAKKHSTVMIGDRMYDMQGAAECHIDAVGVLYGYGSREELCTGYSPVYLADTAQELCAWLIKK